MHEEHRIAFLVMHALLPKHGATYARYRAKKARAVVNAWMFERGAPPLTTAPLPDPTEGLDLPDMINLARRTQHELGVTLDPHGADCTRCALNGDEAHIPTEGAELDLMSMSTRADGSWVLNWGDVYCGVRIVIAAA